MKAFPYLVCLIGMFFTQSLMGQYTYNVESPQSCGGGTSGYKYFTHTATPLTTVGGTMTVYWLACKSSNRPNPYADLYIDIGGSWVLIGRGTSSVGCSWRSATFSVTATQLNNAINTAPGGQINTRVYIRDQCAAGVGCRCCSDPCAKVRITYDHHPQALFSSDISSTCVGGGIIYTDESKGPITTYEWDFGAGAIPATANTAGPHQVAYSTPGTKTVSLILTDPVGTDTNIKVNYVSVFPGPSSIISGSATEEWQALSNGGSGHLAHASFADQNGNYYVTTEKSNGSNGKDIYTIKYDASGNEVWTANYNGPGNGDDRPRAITVDPAGNVYLAATVRNSSNNDIATIKYSPTGTQEWVGLLGGSGNNNDEASAITVDPSGNVFVTGWMRNSTDDVVLVKYNAFGLKEWDTSFNGNGNAIDRGYDLALDGNGNIYVGGYTRNSFNYDYLLLKFNFLGMVTWNRTYNGPGAGDDYAFDLLRDNAGDLILAGSSRPGTSYAYTFVKWDANGTQQWARNFFTGFAATTWDFQRMVVDAADNIYFVGDPINAGTEEIALVKMNAAGTQQWDSRFSWLASTINDPQWIEIADSANIYVFGITNNGSNNDVVTVKFDSSGNYKWDAVYNGCAGGADVAVSAVVGPDNNVVVTGSNSQVFSVKYGEYYQPQAGFSLSETVICESELLMVSDTSTGSITSWNWDFGADATPANATTEGPHSVQYATGGTKTITLITTGPVGADTTSQVVTVNALPTANAGTDLAICTGNSTALSGSGGVAYSWSPGIGLSSTVVANPTASPTVNTTYTLTVTDGNNCSAADDVTVTVNALPTANAGSDVAICTGNSTPLSGSGGNSYSWSPGGGLSNATISNPVANPTSTTTYTLTVTDGNTCTNTDNVTVTVNPLPIANAGADVTFCAGNSTTLNGSGGTGYSWTPGTGLSSTTAQSPVATPTATTTYTLTVTDANNCADSDAVTVTVNQLPTANAGADASLCAGNSTTLTGSGGVSYNWTPGSGLSSSTVQNPTANPAVTTTYTLTVTDANNCTDTDAVTLTVNPLPTANAGADIAVCAGNSTTLNASGGAAYNWTPGTGLSSTTTSNPIASPSATSTYTLTVTDANNCTDTDAVTVTVNPLPMANAGADVAVCAGNSTTLAGSGGTTYNWTPGTGLSSTTTANPIATPTSTATYTLTVTDANNCTDTDAVTVTVNPLPTANAGPDVAICTGSSATLSGSGGVSYNWNPGAGLSSSTIQNPLASPPVTTAYTLTVTDGNNCTDTDAVTVTVNPLPTANAGSDVAICAGNSTTLSGNGGASYNWTPGTGLNSSTAQNPIASPTATSIYTLTVTDGNNCTDTDDVIVTVNPLPTANAGSDVAICAGSSTTFSGSGGATYNWSPGTGLSSTSTQSPVATPTTTSTYTLTVTDANNCTDSDAVTVTVNPLPTANAGADVAICAGDTTALVGSGGQSYSWNPGTGLNNPNTQNPLAFPAVTATYSLTVTDGNNCTHTDDVTVTVNATPTANAGQDVTLCDGDSTTLLGTGGGSFMWSPNTDLNSATAQNPVATPTATTTYTLTVTDANNCTDSDEVTVTISPNPVTAFTYTNVGTTVSFSNISTGASTYNWQFGDGNFSTLPVPTHTYINPGVYYCCLTSRSADGCEHQLCDSVDVTASGILETDDAIGIEVFPNPGEGIFTLKLALNTAERVAYQIFDAKGVAVHTSPGEIHGASFERKIDLSFVSAGIYLLKIKVGERSYSKKLVIF